MAGLKSAFRFDAEVCSGISHCWTATRTCYAKILWPAVTRCLTLETQGIQKVSCCGNTWLHFCITATDLSSQVSWCQMLVQIDKAYLKDLQVQMRDEWSCREQDRGRWKENRSLKCRQSQTACLKKYHLFAASHTSTIGVSLGSYPFEFVVPFITC